MTDALVVLVTCGPDDGMKIAEPLVQEGLAACVNILPGITSVFRWNGELTAESEQLLVMKTDQETWATLQKRIKEIHPYETPEILCLSIQDGYGPYLTWLKNSLKK
jgi:periplasmic divalent cation tolerance protein